MFEILVETWKRGDQPSVNLRLTQRGNVERWKQGNTGRWKGGSN
jgi:hypothetical protein